MLVSPTRGISCKHLKFLSTWHTALVTSLSTMTCHCYYVMFAKPHAYILLLNKQFRLFWTFVLKSSGNGASLSRWVVKLRLKQEGLKWANFKKQLVFKRTQSMIHHRLHLCSNKSRKLAIIAYTVHQIWDKIQISLHQTFAKYVTIYQIPYSFLSKSTI